MTTPRESSGERSRRLVYFAVERTLASWIRTALSLMVRDFVADRFDLVMRRAFVEKSIVGLHSHALWH